ncbi:biotin transporter BioY [Fervidobacterium thailandense]|uniref:Biotin transporter n=1 Tax=Fervidobacterium thailandense TaxID=1008305 RepID=A0A1E3G1Z8_9BACT|nr:biotin transporter BioY [Fervidobacterium thailandense]ODN29678.1 biotin transporter BioY [Fervidobacterium thailandense]
MKRSQDNRLFNLALASIFASLTAAGAQISIPLGPVPFTLQVLIIFLAGYLLEPRWAFLSLTIYLILGAIGIPVFANFSSGVGHLVGPTGGYLLAFPLSAFLISYLRRFNKILAGAVGLGVIYTLGWLVLGIHLGNFQKAFKVGVVPFIGFDALKLLMALYISTLVEKRVNLREVEE